MKLPVRRSFCGGTPDRTWVRSGGFDDGLPVWHLKITERRKSESETRGPRVCPGAAPAPITGLETEPGFHGIISDVGAGISEMIEIAE